MSYEYTPHGVCARRIVFDLDSNNVLHDVHFEGGCDGNLKAICKLVEGMKAERVIELLEGNTCGRKTTSCADQFTKALKERI